MSHQTNDNEKEKSKILTNSQQGEGTEYHREHAGNVEGYGQPHPVNSTGKITTNNE